MVTLTIKTGGTCILSLTILLLAFVYKRHGDTDGDELKAQLNTVLNGLLRAEQKVGLDPETRVAVGFGSCLDLIADGLSVLDRVGAEPPVRPRHVNEISSLTEFEEIFAYFFRHGAAAERFVSNDTLFSSLTEAARNIVTTQYKMGGNAPVMASRFHQEGCKVLLGAQMSSTLKTEVSNDIQVVGDELSEDDVHLLLEYSKGHRWGQYQAQRANRFIVHSDVNNPMLVSLESFADELSMFSPNLLVIGGIQMMDNFPFQPGQREARLKKLGQLLASIPKETSIHFEMASFAEESCLQDVVEHILYYTDSLGMNEQELPNLFSLLSNGSMTLISDPYPRVATTLDQMRAVYQILRDTPSVNGRRKLSRLHVHTLAFQAILTTKNSRWKNAMSAAAKASLTANRHTCGSDYISIEKAKILLDESFSMSRDEGSPRVQFQYDRPVSCWEEDDFSICLAPVLVCTDVVQTGGGGDNISSAGLVLQI
ncbi:hypothetical protein LSH36_167g06004 [Paralvinella palmiformis]|uniref:ADP-dependent glucokinase n=1 Tax=Paralvinella palmiformis TaxID=53620 RepID=A0AAD9JU42_9ANNE|nr:hypothetical protein LSH36_167g06004 [Paralvinella palmiformis]